MSANPIVAPVDALPRETRQFAVAFLVMLALIIGTASPCKAEGSPETNLVVSSNSN